MSHPMRRAVGLGRGPQHEGRVAIEQLPPPRGRGLEHLGAGLERSAPADAGLPERRGGAIRGEQAQTGREQARRGIVRRPVVAGREHLEDRLRKVSPSSLDELRRGLLDLGRRGASAGCTCAKQATLDTLRQPEKAGRLRHRDRGATSDRVDDLRRERGQRDRVLSANVEGQPPHEQHVDRVWQRVAELTPGHVVAVGVVDHQQARAVQLAARVEDTSTYRVVLEPFHANHHRRPTLGRERGGDRRLADPGHPEERDAPRSPRARSVEALQRLSALLEERVGRGAATDARRHTRHLVAVVEPVPVRGVAVGGQLALGVPPPKRLRADPEDRGGLGDRHPHASRLVRHAYEVTSRRRYDQHELSRTQHTKRFTASMSKVADGGRAGVGPRSVRVPEGSPPRQHTIPSRTPRRASGRGRDPEGSPPAAHDSERSRSRESALRRRPEPVSGRIGRRGAPEPRAPPPASARAPARSR